MSENAHIFLEFKFGFDQFLQIYNLLNKLQNKIKLKLNLFLFVNASIFFN